MDTEQQLKYVINKHKDDHVETGQTNIALMAEECLRVIKQLKTKIKELEQVKK